MVGSENFFFGTDFPHPEFQVFHSDEPRRRGQRGGRRGDPQPAWGSPTPTRRTSSAATSPGSSPDDAPGRSPTRIDGLARRAPENPESEVPESRHDIDRQDPLAQASRIESQPKGAVDDHQRGDRPHHPRRSRHPHGRDVAALLGAGDARRRAPRARRRPQGPPPPRRGPRRLPRHLRPRRDHGHPLPAPTLVPRPRAQRGGGPALSVPRVEDGRRRQDPRDPL